MSKKLLIASVLVATSLALPSQAEASEGLVKLYNRVGERARCEAYSVLMANYNYKILMNCRDIIYPSEPDVFGYLVWVRSNESNKYNKLGDLGVGKREYDTKMQFDEIIVTKDTGSGGILAPNSPAGQVIMSGSVVRSSYLDGDIEPEETDLSDQIGTTTPTPTPAQKRTNTFLGRLTVVLPILFVAAFITMLILFLVNRLRK